MMQLSGVCSRQQLGVNACNSYLVSDKSLFFLCTLYPARAVACKPAPYASNQIAAYPFFLLEKG